MDSRGCHIMYRVSGANITVAAGRVNVGFRLPLLFFSLSPSHSVFCAIAFWLPKPASTQKPDCNSILYDAKQQLTLFADNKSKKGSSQLLFCLEIDYPLGQIRIVNFQSPLKYRTLNTLALTLHSHTLYVTRGSSIMSIKAQNFQEGQKERERKKYMSVVNSCCSLTLILARKRSEKFIG